MGRVASIRVTVRNFNDGLFFKVVEHAQPFDWSSKGRSRGEDSNAPLAFDVKTIQTQQTIMYGVYQLVEEATGSTR